MNTTHDNCVECDGATVKHNNEHWWQEIQYGPLNSMWQINIVEIILLKL